MTLPRALARLVAVAIVMIAACIGAPLVGASSAQAHQGHGHQGQAYPGHAHPGHTYGERSARAPAAAATLAEMRAAAEGPRLAAASPDEAPAARPCNGLCCLMGASCCLPGLLPESLAAFPSPRPARRLAAAEEAVPPGIVPDSPARPPRPFA